MSGRNTTPWFTIERGSSEEEKKRQARILGQAVQDQVAYLEGTPLESTRRQNLLYDLELYLGTKLTSLYQVNGDGYERLWKPEDLVFNVCYSVVNNIRARVCSFRPRAEFLPMNGDYLADRTSKDRTEMSDAWADKVKYQREASLAFRDMLTGDGGVCKAYIEGDAVKFARFPSWEFLFDEAESIYGEPECGYHVTYLPLELAAQRFKIDEQELRAQTVTAPPGIVYFTNRLLVRVVDAYQSGPDGRHVICVGNIVQLDDPWEWDSPPFIMGRFDERSVGMWGTGAITPIRSIQLEINEFSQAAREAHYLSSLQVWQIPDGESGPSKVSNARVRIERFKNQASNVINPPPLHADWYQYFKILEEQAYKVIGISQFLAAGVKQPGIDSGEGIRESVEIQQDRLAMCSQVWEEMRVDAAEWWWRLTRKLGQKPEWKVISRGTWRKITEHDYDAECQIRKFATSFFGQTMSARYQKVLEAMKEGLLDRENAMKAMDIPDLQPITDVVLAEQYAMQDVCDGILEDGEYQSPDPQIDPLKLEGYARARYLLATRRDANYPEKNLALMRRFLEAVKLAADAARSAQSQPAAPAGAPATVQAPQATMAPSLVPTSQSGPQ